MKSVPHYLTALLLLFSFIFCFFTGEAGSKNAMTFNEEGWAHLKAGRDQKAVFSFRNALRQNPDYEEAMTGLGRAYMNLQIYDQALEIFDKVLKMNPVSSRALTGSGFILIKQGSFTPAMECFRKATEVSAEDMEARFGVALLYYAMDETAWSKRQLKTILQSDPFHFDSLLLLADIKSREGHLSEARELIRKAIDANDEAVRGYITMASIMFREYTVSENYEDIAEALANLNTALAIQPDNFTACFMMGNFLRYSGRIREASVYYDRAAAVSRPSSLLYAMGCCCDSEGRNDEALDCFLETIKTSPSDEIANSRLEQFLIGHDYKIGNPARIMRSSANYESAVRSTKMSMPDESILFLRRSLMLNPMNRKVREELMQYYKSLDYDRLYIEELKELLRLNPDTQLRDRLAAAVVKRRSRLYAREGYASEMVPRNVPVVMVMDLQPVEGYSEHQDAGQVLANDIVFAMQQFGRMNTPGYSVRNQLCGLRTDGDYFEKTITVMQQKISEKVLPDVDYIVFGTFREHGNRLDARLSLMDFRKAMIITTFDIKEEGRGNVLRLSLHAARRIFEKIPFSGMILKVKDDSIIVNLGLADSVKPGSKIGVYKYAPELEGVRLTRQIIFTVKEADTWVCSAVPDLVQELNNVDVHDIIVPVKNRRSVRIE